MLLATLRKRTINVFIKMIKISTKEIDVSQIIETKGLHALKCVWKHSRLNICPAENF